MESIWTRELEMPKFSTLAMHKKVDTLIVGGGMTGLLCGHFLNRQGADYALIERDRIAGGVTKNTTAKITAYHGLIYSKLLKAFGREKTAAYLQANQAAVEQYRKLCAGVLESRGGKRTCREEQKISCDFLEKDNWIYTTDHPKAILEEAKALREIDGRAAYMERLEIPLPAVCGIKAPAQAQFHPLKFAAAIAARQREHICEKTVLVDFERTGGKWTAQVLNGQGMALRIEADRVIMATHFPFIDRWGMYFMKMYQARSYVLALENSDGTKPLALSGMYIGIGKEKRNPLNLSFRTCGKYLLFGGGGGRTGSQYPAYGELEAVSKKLYPKSRVVTAWAAQDCMTLDGVPYIGPYARGKEGLLVATGFNKWGMTGAMAAAMLLTGEMEPALAEVFSPRRSVLRRQLAVNLFETGKNFLRPTAPRCTHLGCALKWNPHEKTWDCACHGSRFAGEGETKGKVIDNPAQVGLHR